MDNPEKLATQGHTRRRKTKQKNNTICVGHTTLRKQRQIR